MDRCFRIFNHLTDPSRRSPLCLKFSLLAIHLVYAGVLFLFDGDLIEKTKKEPWYTALYLLLFIVTLIQYLATAISSPGYVLDAMMAVNKRNVMYTKTPETSKPPALSRNGSVIVAIEGNQTGRNIPGSNATSWSKLVTELTGTCTYCNVEQPPRAKHCHVCGKCVLQFDHHCVWLGNCVGQESALCIQTGVLYISYLKAHITIVWWQDVIMILLLITLSISLIGLLLLLLYHRRIPERVHPFSKGVCGDVYNFCCASMYGLEPLATPQDIEEKSRPYTCWDVATCRCC